MLWFLSSFCEVMKKVPENIRAREVCFIMFVLVESTSKEPSIRRRSLRSIGYYQEKEYSHCCCQVSCTPRRANCETKKQLKLFQHFLHRFLKSSQILIFLLSLLVARYQPQKNLLLKTTICEFHSLWFPSNYNSRIMQYCKLLSFCWSYHIKMWNCVRLTWKRFYILRWWVFSCLVLD